MTDYIIIGLLALLVLENSRFGVRIMDGVILLAARIRHGIIRLARKVIHA